MFGSLTQEKCGLEGRFESGGHIGPMAAFVLAQNLHCTSLPPQVREDLCGLNGIFVRQ